MVFRAREIIAAKRLKSSNRSKRSFLHEPLLQQSNLIFIGAYVAPLLVAVFFFSWPQKRIVNEDEGTQPGEAGRNYG